MATEAIVVGGLYRYKGKTYKVTNYEPEVRLVKDPSDSNWYNAVEYAVAANGHPDSAMRFTRQEEDFKRKFTDDDEASFGNQDDSED